MVIPGLDTSDHRSYIFWGQAAVSTPKWFANGSISTPEDVWWKNGGASHELPLLLG